MVYVSSAFQTLACTVAFLTPTRKPESELKCAMCRCGLRSAFGVAAAVHLPCHLRRGDGHRPRFIPRRYYHHHHFYTLCFPSSFACELTLTLSFFRPNAVDFALATECLPSEESRGTDLAVWNLAMSLPIAFSGPLGGVMLDNGQRVGHALNLPNLGYVGLFASCGFLLALSAFFVRRITVGNPVRRRKPTNGDVPPFRAPCACACAVVVCIVDIPGPQQRSISNWWRWRMMAHSSSGQQVRPLGEGCQPGDEDDGKTSSFVSTLIRNVQILLYFATALTAVAACPWPPHAGCGHCSFGCAAAVASRGRRRLGSPCP